MRIVDSSGRACVSRARNAGLAAALGDRLLICDGDDEVEPQWIERMGAALCHHELVTGTLDRCSLNRPDQYGWIGEPVTVAEVAYGFLPFAAGGNLGMRRGVLDVLGGFDEHLRRAEDIDFSWRAYYSGFRVHGEPSAVIRVRMGGQLRSVARTRFRGGVAEAALHRRHRRHGMAAESSAAVRSVWRELATNAPILLHEPDRRYEWVATVAKRAGRVAGSLRHRTVFL